METKDAVTLVEDFLARYQASGAWHVAPERITVGTSKAGDDHLTIVFAFGVATPDSQLDKLKQQAIDALRAAHPELARFQLDVTAEIAQPTT